MAPNSASTETSLSRTKILIRLLYSILFLAVTAEEQGLLGSDYYATHPIYPLTKTAAVINMDSLNIYGPMKDIRIVGYGQSELDDYLEDYALEVERIVLPNPTPEKGSFFRSDHFPFAKQGVPALNAGSGVQHIEKGEEWGLEQIENYIREKYHKPSDEYDPAWDLSGMRDDQTPGNTWWSRLAASSPRYRRVEMPAERTASTYAWRVPCRNVVSG